MTLFTWSFHLLPCEDTLFLLSGGSSNKVCHLGTREQTCWLLNHGLPSLQTVVFCDSTKQTKAGGLQQQIFIMSQFCGGSRSGSSLPGLLCLEVSHKISVKLLAGLCLWQDFLGLQYLFPNGGGNLHVCLPISPPLRNMHAPSICE